MKFRPNEAFQIPLPVIAPDTRYLSFSFNCKYGGFKVGLQYVDRNPEGVSIEKWMFSVTDTTGMTITGTLNPNCIHNSKSNSYGIIFVSNLESVGRLDLSKISMYLMVWV
jgi:hypothetical protein